MIQETKTVTFTITKYNESGETDGVYTVGDTIKATMLNGNGTEFGKLNGVITEIFVDEERRIHQLQINNGWCCHPEEFYKNHDRVEIVKSFELLTTV